MTAMEIAKWLSPATANEAAMRVGASEEGSEPLKIKPPSLNSSLTENNPV